MKVYKLDEYDLTLFRLRKRIELSDYERTTNRKYYWFRLYNNKTKSKIWLSSVDYDFKTIDDVYIISTTYYNIYNDNYFTIEEEYKIYFRNLKLKNLKS